MRKVLPVLFNTDMVRAILDGRKTVTRRLVKKSQCMLADRKEPHELNRKYDPFDGMTDAELVSSTYRPPCQQGDILYVRETWAFLPCVECMDEGPSCHIEPVVYDDGDCESEGCFVYKASHPRPERVSWTPSIHMPKQAARIWLKVTNVWAERLQDMNIDDFIAEGVAIRPEAFNDPENAYQQAKEEFIHIWDSTIKKADIDRYCWSASPWVWAIGFERCEKPET